MVVRRRKSARTRSRERWTTGGGGIVGALALAVSVDQEGPEEGALVQRVHPARSAFRSKL